MRSRLPFFVLFRRPLSRNWSPNRLVGMACCAMACLLPVCAVAQQPQTTTDPTGDAPNINPYAVTELDANHQVWQSVVAQTNASGDITYQTNSFTEMATGMH